MGTEDTRKVLVTKSDIEIAERLIPVLQHWHKYEITVDDVLTIALGRGLDAMKADAIAQGQLS